MITKFIEFLNEKYIEKPITKKSINKRNLRYAKKLYGFNMLGGKCKYCGDDNIFHMTFHHRDRNDKSFGISLNKDASWDDMIKEFKKCDLLCYNCHAKYHYDESESNDLRRQTKKVLVDYMGGVCQKCGYGKNEGDSFAALSFHHKNDKKFSPGMKSLRVNNISEVPQEYIDEIEKCDLLCMNCHQEEHARKELRDKYIDDIIKKSKNPITRNPNTDKDEVLRLLKSGMSQNQISKKLGKAKSTISRISNILRKEELI